MRRLRASRSPEPPMCRRSMRALASGRPAWLFRRRPHLPEIATGCGRRPEASDPQPAFREMVARKSGRQCLAAPRPKLSNRMPLRWKNSPPAARLTVRITSGRDESSVSNARAAFSAPSGVVASMTVTMRSIRCGKARSSLTSCCRHGSELDNSLLLSVLIAKLRTK